MTYLCIVTLLTISIMCIVGSFAPQFQDNVLQRIGMSVIGFSSSVQAIRVYETEKTTTLEFVIYLGVLLFAIGTFVNNHHFVRSCKRQSQNIWHSHL